MLHTVHRVAVEPPASAPASDTLARVPGARRRRLLQTLSQPKTATSARVLEIRHGRGLEQTPHGRVNGFTSRPVEIGHLSARSMPSNRVASPECRRGGLGGP